MNIRTYTNSNQHLPTDLNAELLRLSTKLEDATDDLQKHSQEYAANEYAYRQAKALAYIKFQNDPGGGRRTVEMIKAVVDRECERERMNAYLSRAMKEAGLEKVRSLRAQLSALQSVAAAMRSEMEMAGKGTY
jgi:hypothetical protein